MRLNAAKGAPDRYAAYFHCQTKLISAFREIYPRDFAYEGERAMIFALGEPVPLRAFKHCVALALTYHARKRASARRLA